MHPLDKFTKYLCKILDVVPERNLLVSRNNALCITHHINQQNFLFPTYCEYILFKNV